MAGPRFDPDSFESPDAARVVAVGGANTDVVGFPDAALAYGDSNPGRVRTYPGGVARNVAHNLARLAVDVHLVTAFGSDVSSYELAEECREVGVAIDASLFDEELPGARYVAIDDERHELSVAIADMRVIDCLTASVLAVSERHELLLSADVIVADCNLAQDSLRWLAENTSAPLVIETVSAAKAPRALPLLGRTAAIKPNGHEAEAILGRPVTDLDQAVHAARDLVAAGAQRAFVTPGAAGIGWADADSAGRVEFPSAAIENTIGAGDAFVAGVVYAMLSGTDTAHAAMLGSACSAITLESPDTVSPQMSREAAFAAAKELFA